MVNLLQMVFPGLVYDTILCNTNNIINACQVMIIDVRVKIKYKLPIINLV